MVFTGLQNKPPESVHIHPTHDPRPPRPRDHQRPQNPRPPRHRRRRLFHLGGLSRHTQAPPPQRDKITIFPFYAGSGIITPTVQLASGKTVTPSAAASIPW